jgi:hypothetical protein
MGFAQESGYVPVDIATIMLSIMNNINTQFGTSYTADNFVGTNFYKYFYALAQKHQENEIKTAEIFLKLQQYFEITNELISRPVVTNPGLVEKLAAEGYIASVKPMIDADAGKIHICVDVDDADPDYAATKLAICTIIKDSTVAGAVTQGSESETIVLSNGQSFDFKFALPDPTPVLLRLTTTLSDNNQVVILSPEEQKQLLMDNIAARYRLGKNFEPQRYFSLTDAPWASDVLLEWSDDAGSNYYSTVFDAEFDDLFTFGLEDIELVEN